MNCTNCNYPIPEGIRFCTNCGCPAPKAQEAVSVAKEPEPVSGPPKPTKPATTYYQNGQIVTDSSTSSTHAPWEEFPPAEPVLQQAPLPPKPVSASKNYEAGLTIAFGIISIVFGLTILFSAVGLILGTLGIILAVNGMKVRPIQRSFTAGLTLSIIGTSFSCLTFLFCAWAAFS